MNKKTPIVGSFGQGYFRVVEILAVLIVLTLAVGVGYLAGNKLKEESDKLSDLQKRSIVLRDQIRQIKISNENKAKIPDTTKVAIESLEKFQSKFLKDRQEGRLYVINQINKLVKNNGVNLTSGISFERIDSAETSSASDDRKTSNNEEKKTNKRRKAASENNSIYPAVDVSFSVQGNYSNFRKFLYALETDKMFFVIDALSLQTQDAEAKTSTGNGRIVATQRTIQQNPGEVTVQINLKAYFRREKDVTN